MSSQVKTGLTSWKFTAPLIPWFLFTIHKMKESKESWLTTKTSCPVKPENSFHSHRGSPITTTATSVMSLCVLSTATTPVFRKAHLYTYTLAVARAITFPATPTSVAWNVLFFIKKALPCPMSGLLGCISCRRCSAIYIDETGRLFVNKSTFPVSRNFYVRKMYVRK